MGEDGFRRERHLEFESLERGAEFRGNDSSFNPFPAVMTRQFYFAAAALLASLFGAGCGERRVTAISETEEPFYAEAVTLNTGHRYGEALASYLKVIDRRGELGAPESHLDAGVIYLNHIKDPVRAYYHFSRYLDLKANSSEAPKVRGLQEAALVRIAARFPGFPADGQSGRLGNPEEVTRLRRENEELRAELQTLRGYTAQTTRSRVGVTLPENSVASTPPPHVPIEGINPVTSANLFTQQPQTQPRQTLPQPTQPSGTRTTTPQPTKATTSATQPRPGATQVQPPATAARPSGRTHTVKAKETLYGISRQYGVKMEDLQRANGLTASSSLKVGAVLKIP